MPKDVTQVAVEVPSSAMAALGATTKAEVEAISRIAISQWLGILFGPTRPRTLTELYLDLLREIFTFNEGTVEPTQSHLYGALNFPFGQAGYLSRVLREDQPLQLRRRFLEELAEKLTDRRAEAEEWTKVGRGAERMSLQVSKSARRELEHMMGTLIAGGQAVHPLRNEGYLGDYVSVQVVAEDIGLILTRAAEELKVLGDAE